MASAGDLGCAFAVLMEEGSPNCGPMHCVCSDTVIVKAAREVLMGVRYPDDDKRRLLYASWLTAFASGVWQEGIHDIMLNCVAAMPSLSNPAAPLFADIFKIGDPVDRSPPRGFVLSLSRLPVMFRGKRKDIEPLPESSAFLKFMADLIRKSVTCQTSLNEAGMIIGFCSLALAVVVFKQLKNVHEFLMTHTKKTLTAVVPTTFDGDIPWPRGRFVTRLARMTHSPFVALLALGQYIYHLKAGEKAPSADLKFLVEAFLAPAKFGRLEPVELFCSVQQQTGLSEDQLGEALAEVSKPMMESTARVLAFLEHGREPTQQVLPWSRAASCCFFQDLGLVVNVDLAMRLTAFLAPDASDQLWQKPEFRAICESRVKEARVWAREFKRSLRKGKYGDLPNWKP